MYNITVAYLAWRFEKFLANAADDDKFYYEWKCSRLSLTHLYQYNRCAE